MRQALEVDIGDLANDHEMTSLGGPNSTTSDDGKIDVVICGT